MLLYGYFDTIYLYNRQAGVDRMAKQNSFIGILLICLGGYLLLQQVNIALLEPFHTWPSILMIVGGSLVVHCYLEKNFHNLMIATLILGLGIHFHGLMHYDFWINHWAMYPLIVGASLVIRSLRTKKGFLLGALFIGFSVLMIFSVQMPEWFNVFYSGFDYIEAFWPLLLVLAGIYCLRKKPKTE